MDRRILYAQLLERQDQYRTVHGRTVETDIAILREFARGRCAAQIAMEIPCGEATVYRAINRVKNFVKK